MTKTSSKKPAASAPRAGQRMTTTTAHLRGTTDKPMRLHPRIKTTSATKAAQRATTRRDGSKLNTVIQLMQTKSGASIDQLVKATGWQAHSVRGAISGAIKKKLGLKVLSERVSGARVYRIAK